MRTSLKVILTATSVAVLASPVMAQPEQHQHAASTRTLSSNAHAAAVRGRIAPAAVIEGNRINLDDCVHVQFPQCGSEGL
jgi:hypothetical protein